MIVISIAEASVCGHLVAMLGTVGLAGPTTRLWNQKNEGPANEVVVFACREEESQKQTIFQRDTENGRQVDRIHCGADADESGPTEPTRGRGGGE